MAHSTTSITVSRFEKFKNEASDREQLGCSKIPGLLLLKLKRGSTWRFRYTDPVTGKRLTDTIADGETKPEQAAQIAMIYRQNVSKGISPRSIKEANQAKQRQARQDADSNQYLNAGQYFEAIYTPFQIAHRRTGKFILNGIRNNFGHLFDRDMDKLTGADIAAWFHERRQNNISRVTLVREFSAFKAMLNHAATPGDESMPILDSNPLKAVKLPRKTVIEREAQEGIDREAQNKRNVIPDETKQKLRKGLELFAEHTRAQRRSSREHGKPFLSDLDQVHFPHWFIPFCHMAWLTGMRPGDIRATKWENLSYNRFNKQTLLTFTPQKTKDKGDNPAKVQFPIGGELLEVFTKWQEQQGSPKTGYVFQSDRTGAVMDKKAYRAHWAKVKKLGGITEGLDFYAFRHNFISQLVLQGAPLLAVARLVGHKDGKMIAENYFHLGNQDAAAIVSKFGESINGQAKAVNTEARS
jgi:integrase